ncbi:MAG TPA: HAD-IIA family hydrolase [Candidatus Hydrogenedentes bacterium]|nr:HAD-IIA family hydrolase [Candidatus Hydrogenedentota bacterium]
MKKTGSGTPVGFLLDMDGVIYRGSELIPGALEFIRALQDQGIPFMFLTNNSQRTRLDIAMKLQRLGFNVEERHVYTCAIATAEFLASQKPNGTAFVIGEGGLLNALHEKGWAVTDQDPDYVVVGEGRTFTFEVIEQAVNLILGGARLVATNLDPNCPTARGARPGCGAIAAMLERATGVQPFSVGKPSPIMMRAARKALGLDAAHTVMIGDTMDTDILGGVNMGYRTILVLSGNTRREDLSRYAFRPNLVVDHLGELVNLSPFETAEWVQDEDAVAVPVARW